MRKTQLDYDTISEEFSATRREIWEEMKFLFDFLKKGDRVLDLGCGNGRWYPLFKEKEVDYFGVDFSEKLVAIAKKTFPEAKFLVANALSLPFENHFFDKIYSIAVLHQIPSFDFRIQFLKECKRVLKPEGILILTVWKIYRPKEMLLLLKYTILKILGKSKLDFKDIFEPWGKKIQRYYHCFSKRELENLVKKAGFEILKSGLVKNKKGNRKNFFVVCKKPS